MEFVWRKDNRIVLTDNEIELQNFKFSSTLLFSNLKPQHAGVYTCIVSNSVASNNYSAFLNIKGNIIQYFTYLSRCIVENIHILKLKLIEYLFIIVHVC